MKTPTLTLLLVIGAALPGQPPLIEVGVREATGFAGVPGSLLLCGGGRLPHEVTDLFFRLAGGVEARIVVLPTASLRADGADPEAALDEWRPRGPRWCRLLHTRDRARADTDAFVTPLREATGVWIGGGQQSRLSEAYRGTKVEAALRAVLARGGVVGGTSAGAACTSAVMIAGGAAEPRLGAGFDLLPGAIVDQHSTERGREPRLRRAVTLTGDRWGIGIDEATAVLVQGRRLRVVGRGRATVVLPPGKNRPLREDRLARGGVADIVALHRAARARAGAPFPPATMPPPLVRAGTLVLVGGGRLPQAAVQRFVTAAGGPEAPIVVVPTAIGDRVPSRAREAAAMAAAGARDITLFHAERRSQLADPAFLAPLRRARGVWFGGGRQWRLVDRYAGTKALELFHDVLRRGGAIGGSSAGTSIQAEYMVRGSPLGNRDMMAEGYERGFGFLPGCAVDQHFAQRRRFRDMTAVMRAWPQLLGLGVDESTAIVVSRSILEVVGRGHVAVYDWSSGAPEGDRDHLRLPAGSRYDMAARRVLFRPDK